MHMMMTPVRWLSVSSDGDSDHDSGGRSTRPWQVELLAGDDTSDKKIASATSLKSQQMVTIPWAISISHHLAMAALIIMNLGFLGR